MVTRNKKDSHARIVWPNDPSLALHIDDEFKSIWHKIKLPEAGALADDLEKAGLTPANKSRGGKGKAKAARKENEEAEERGEDD